MSLDDHHIKQIQELDTGEILLPNSDNKKIKSSIKIHSYNFESENWIAYSLKLFDCETQNSCERVFYQRLKNIKINTTDFVNSYFLDLKKMLTELKNFNEDA